MLFDTYSEVDSVCHDLKLADHERGLKRKRINDLFNGMPPYTARETVENNIKINFNDLTATIQGHDARAQLYSAFNKPGNYFKATTDMGSKYKRAEYGVVVTREVNRIMKRSLEYYECYRSKLALDVLHGIGPACWDGPERWCPDPLGIEDVLVPAGTYLTLRNFDRFAFYRAYSYPELAKLTRGPHLDPGWNQDLLQAVHDWFQDKASDLMRADYSESGSPDKWSEALKENEGWYAADRLPTLNVYDFYFWSKENGKDGWYRRIILDGWDSPSQRDINSYVMNRKDDGIFKKNEFLYNSGTRKVADHWSELVSFQFADLSAVAPFRYHSVRSLGWLLYAPCMFQNLLRCKFNTHVFESLMQYFRVRTSDEAERALKIELIDKGFIDDTVNFVPPQERWQINAQVVQAAFEQWDHLIRRNALSYTQPLPNDQDKTRKTAFQVQTEVNSTASLVATAFEQAYRYQAKEYREILRRFFRPNSLDPEVNLFRANCLRRGVPETLLTLEAWDIEPERVMGAGNKSIEIGIANWLMQNRPMYDPEPQREILHQATLMVTDDPGLTNRLVPQKPMAVTDSTHDAELVASTLMQGIPVDIKTGMNHIEYVEKLIFILSKLMQGTEARGGMATPRELNGFQLIIQHIGQHIAIIAQDQNETQRVRKYGDDLGKLANIVKGYEQRLAEQMQQQADQQGGNGQLSPEEQAKIAATNAQAQAKIEQGKESHAAKTVQRQIAFEQKIQQDAQKQQAELAMLNAKTLAEIQRDNAKAMNEPQQESPENP